MTDQYSFKVDKIALLLREDVLQCAPDPIVTAFYTCVILRKLKTSGQVVVKVRTLF